LVEAYIQRITDINAMINAVAEHNFDEARRRARQVDAMLDGLDPNQIHSVS
jgi:Asp-tRNA(Asn)/Glu-tRNA(Gln) amidotransferase A subunit family amidase